MVNLGERTHPIEAKEMSPVSPRMEDDIMSAIEESQPESMVEDMAMEEGEGTGNFLKVSFRYFFSVINSQVNIFF